MPRALLWIAAAGVLAVALLLLWTPRPAPAPAPSVPPYGSAPAETQPITPPPAAAAPEAPRDAPAPPAPAALAPDAAPDRALLRGALDAALANHLDRVKLSPDQLDALADAAWTLRSSREALRALPESPAHADERRALVEASAQANADFERILGMTPGEFTEAVQPGVGVDSDASDEPVPEPEFIEVSE